MLLSLTLLTLLNATAQQGFVSVERLDAVSISTTTGEKPQSKVWTYAGAHWTVLPNSSGTHLWRLDGKRWTSVRNISSKSTSKADCKVVGNTVHILLHQGGVAQLVSLEYNAAAGTYQPWQQRTNTVEVPLDDDSETATIDIDGTGRMWVAFNGDDDDNEEGYDGKETDNIFVRWSDYPYGSWSQRHALATDVDGDDMCAVIAMPGMVGVFWSDQKTKRYGFRTHADGAAPTIWSVNEVPASQSALNIGRGMADDHLNLAISSNGTLYCAVKSSYDNTSYPEVSLLVRRPNGNWDNLYEVSKQGTRPIVILDKAGAKVRVIYTHQDGGGNIYYKESSTSSIAFGQQLTLISGTYDNATSAKDNFTSEVVILASSKTQAVGVLAKDGTTPAPPIIASTPLPISPVNQATGIATSPTLNWAVSEGAETYGVQISMTSNFATISQQISNIYGTSAYVTGLANSTTYYWRVRATNAAGHSSWSSTWAFTTVPAAPVLASVPVLQSPADQATGVSASPELVWQSSQGADTYRVQVSATSSFAAPVYEQAGIAGTRTTVAGLTEGTAYYWRVLAANTAGESAWSPARSFITLQAPPVVASAPMLTSPADEAADMPTNVSLGWNSSKGADAYKAQISDVSDFSSLFFSTSNITDTTVTVAGLATGTTYYWRVLAANAAGESAWSPVRRFTTADGEGPAPAGPLVAHWKMDEEGGSSLLDASPYGNHAATSGGPARVAGVAGRALGLNGTSQYATAPDRASLDLSGAITVAAWIRPEKKDTQYVVKKAEQGSVDGYELSLASTGKVFFRLNQRSSGDTYRLNSVASYPTDGSTWMHVAVTYDGAVMRLYVDGVENSAKSFAGGPAIAPNQLPLTIGAGANGYRGLKGAVDEVRLYSTALSASQVRELATNTLSASSTAAALAVAQPDAMPGDLIAYPNPFSAIAKVNFSLAEDDAYTVTLYDSKGAIAAELKRGEALAGEHVKVELDGSSLSDGLYILRLHTAKGSTKTIKLILKR